MKGERRERYISSSEAQFGRTAPPGGDISKGLRTQRVLDALSLIEGTGTPPDKISTIVRAISETDICDDLPQPRRGFGFFSRKSR